MQSTSCLKVVEGAIITSISQTMRDSEAFESQCLEWGLIQDIVLRVPSAPSYLTGSVDIRVYIKIYSAMPDMSNRAVQVPHLSAAHLSTVAVLQTQA
jgi:hypothetical protein